MTQTKESFVDYEGFVNKFKRSKRKKTTDDCYTPPKVYEAIKDYVVQKYKLEKYNIVRPFHPDTEYTLYPYEERDVVIDNPPFSILGAIVAYYMENNIKFFLFAPHLTLLATGRNHYKQFSRIIVGKGITFENGAEIPISFVTNLEKTPVIKTDPELLNIIKKAQAKPTHHKNVTNMPAEIVTTRVLNSFVTRGLHVELPLTECLRIDAMDAQNALKKTIFGDGLIISERLYNEYKELFTMVNEARKLKCSELLPLSDREKEIMKNLNP